MGKEQRLPLWGLGVVPHILRDTSSHRPWAGPFLHGISYQPPRCWQVLWAGNLGWRLGANDRADTGSLYSMLACYLVSSMVIVT